MLFMMQFVDKNYVNFNVSFYIGIYVVTLTIHVIKEWKMDAVRRKHDKKENARKCMVASFANR